jgi:hypothetical protein
MPDGPLLGEVSDGGIGAPEIPVTDPGIPEVPVVDKGDFPNTTPQTVLVCPVPTTKKKKKKKTPCTLATMLNNLKNCGQSVMNDATNALGHTPPVSLASTTSTFDAETDTHAGTITINPAKGCCAATESLAFELQNVINSAALNAVDANAAAGDVAREDYARQKEALEYQGLVPTIALLNKCKKAWGCSTHAFSLLGAEKATSFDDFYNNYEGEDHKDFYRKTLWDKLYKGPYLKKQRIILLRNAIQRALGGP